MPVSEQKYGRATLKWQPAKDTGFIGAVILDGKRVALIEDEDEDRLLVRLRNEAGRLHPDYVGFDGAMRRYLHFFPGGFQSAANASSERGYKERAAGRLRASLSIEQAFDADTNDAAALANGCMRTLRAIYNHARKAARELPPDNPTMAVDWNTEKRRNTALGAEDLPQWFLEAGRLRHPIRREFQLFMLLSGSRPGALMQARIEDLDLRRRILHIPRPKGGAKRAFDIPLSRPMIQCLVRAMRASRIMHPEQAESWIFAAPARGGPDRLGTRFLSGADCKWTRLGDAPDLYVRKNGRAYRLRPTKEKRWDLYRIKDNNAAGAKIGTYGSRGDASKAIEKIAFEPEPRW